MKQLSTYVDWNFADTWGINPDTNLGYPYLRSPSEESIPVIVIPGIMGSELYAAEDDYLCWPRIILHNPSEINDGLQRLHMNDDGESDEDIETRGFVKSPDYYSEMIEQLRTSGFNVEEFPYDWRMDNNDTAELLHDKISSTLQKYNADEVDIIAHSMGGLVSKAYLNKYGTEHKVRKLVTIGTPHLGAPKMFNSWKTGVLYSRIVDIPLNEDVVRHVTRNFSSIYQLLPSRDYFSYEGAYYEEGFDTNGDGLIKGRIYDYNGMEDWFHQRYKAPEYKDLNWNMLDNAEAFHDTLDKMIITDNSLVEGYMIASDRQATPVLLRDYFGTFGKKHENKVEKLKAGDGTVPTISATNGQIRHNQIFYVNDGTHGGLLNLAPVIQKTIHILNSDANTPVDGIRSGEPAELNGYYAYAACPVDLYVTDSEGQVAGPETWGTSMINYWITGKTKHAFIHDDNFEIALKGTGEGIADLVIERYENGEKTERYSYFAIPTDEGSDVRLAVSGTPQNLLIDTDGNGTYETTAAPDNVASGAALADITGPIVTSDLNGAYFNQDVTVNISAHDQSGIEKIMYTINDGSWSEMKGSSLTFNQEGGYQTSVCALDKAGNWSDLLEFTIFVDKTAPLIVTNLANGMEIERFGSFTISNSADDQLSGIAQLSTTLDGQIINNAGSIDTETLSFSNHTITITAVDKAGNITSSQITIKITASMSTVDKLVDRYYQSGEINNEVVYRSLKFKLEHEITLLPFMLEVKAVRGIHITKPAADKLLDYCEWIIKDKYSCKL